MITTLSLALSDLQWPLWSDFLVAPLLQVLQDKLERGRKQQEAIALIARLQANNAWGPQKNKMGRLLELLRQRLVETSDGWIAAVKQKQCAADEVDLCVFTCLTKLIERSYRQTKELLDLLSIGALLDAQVLNTQSQALLSAILDSGIDAQAEEPSRRREGRFSRTGNTESSAVAQFRQMGLKPELDRAGYTPVDSWYRMKRDAVANFELCAFRLFLPWSLLNSLLWLVEDTGLHKKYHRIAQYHSSKPLYPASLVFCKFASMAPTKPQKAYKRQAKKEKSTSSHAIRTPAPVVFERKPREEKAISTRFRVSTTQTLQRITS